MKRKRIFSCFLTVMLVLVMAMPVFAASGKTPSAVSVTKAAAAKNSVTVTWKKSKYAFNCLFHKGVFFVFLKIG